MTDYLRTPDTPADTLRDTLLGALVGLARSTSSEPKTENTDAVLNAGLRLAAQPDAPAETLQRMLDITRAEKHAVAPTVPPAPCPAATQRTMTLPGCAVQRPLSGSASCGCCRPCSAWLHSKRMPTCSWPFTGACSPFPRTGAKNFWTR